MKLKTGGQPPSRRGNSRDKTAKAVGSPRRGAGVAAATTKVRLTGVAKPAKKKPGNLFKGAYKVKDRYASVPRTPVDPLGAL